jgi:hypothetical protein
MSLPELPHNSSRAEMRKALIRLRMEMHRQEIRHESRELLLPLQRMRGMTQNLQENFGIKHAPLWGGCHFAGLHDRQRRQTRWRQQPDSPGTAGHQPGTLDQTGPAKQFA